MISSVELLNFKCFERMRCNLAPLTVLSGLNSSGKSTVFQSLLLVRQSYLQNYLPGQGLLLNGELASVGMARDVLCDYAQEDKIGISIGTDSGEAYEWRFAYDRESDVLTLDEELWPPTGRLGSLFQDTFQYLSAERLGPRTSFDIAEHAVRGQHRIGTRGENAAYYLSVYGRAPISLTSAANPDAASLDLRDQVEAWLSNVSPGVRLDLTPHTTMDLVQLQYSFVGGGDESNQRRPQNVGFGLTYTLPVVLAALASSPGSLLLIENPEAHIHARGQTNLAVLLARVAAAGGQVLIETHSDHILNGIRRAVHQGDISAKEVSILFFNRTETRDRVLHVVSTPNIATDGSIDYWPEGFFDEWERSLEVLLGSNRA